MTCACGKPAEAGRTQCFRCRVSSVGFGFRGSAREGKSNWNQTAREWKQENFGTADDKVLESRGIVPASEYAGSVEDQ
mgnify:CR=1 FL=1